MIDLIRATEVRHRLGNITATTEARWRDAGKLPLPIKIGRDNFYIESEVSAIWEALAAKRGKK
jgi:predicted DNA-binding transcriptional regulator AlpA